MHWPSVIAVNIDYGPNEAEEPQIEETTAHKLRDVTHYGDYGPMAEYESVDGEKFWIDGQYWQACVDNKTIPTIPVEVITRNAEIQEKIDLGNAQQRRQQKQVTTGLILPDDYPVV